MDELFSVLISLAFTVAKYCAFPLIFAGVRKSPITKKNYKILCWIVNSVLWVAFLVNISYNGGDFSIIPFILWTKVFTSIGISKLDKKGALEQIATTNYSSDDKDSSEDLSHSTENIIYNNYCRKCGAPLSKDSAFCNKCGEKIISIEECENELS